jgi:hypothetical protein
MWVLYQGQWLVLKPLWLATDGATIVVSAFCAEEGNSAGNSMVQRYTMGEQENELPGMKGLPMLWELGDV